MLKIVTSSFFSFMFILVFSNTLFAGPKTDTIYFQNGDKLTCEFKSLQNNLLHVSTSDAGSFDIEWKKIDSLYIKQLLLIMLKDGTKIIGEIMPSDSIGMIAVDVGFNTLTIQHSSIIQMYSYKKKIVKRMSGNIGAGYSAAKANKLRTYDIHGELKYTSDKSLSKINYDGNLTNQEEVDKNERHEVKFNYYYHLPNRFYYNILTSAEHNTELKLDLRTNIGGGFGNNFIYNNHSIAFASIGVQANREFTSDSISNNLEGIITLSYSLFKYNSPKINITISSDLYPNLIDFERIRSTTNTKLRWEIFNDFYLTQSLYFTYDTKPLSTNAVKGDWSFSMGFEYSFY